MGFWFILVLALILDIITAMSPHQMTWYILDDNRVYNVSEQEVLNRQAYMLFYVRDRKNIVSRKSVDIIKKENGNMDSAAANQVLKGLFNGLAENKSCESSLNAQAQIKMSNFDSSVVSFTKYSLVQQKSCPSLAGSFVQNKKPISDPFPRSSHTKDHKEGSPLLAQSTNACRH